MKKRIIVLFSLLLFLAIPKVYALSTDELLIVNGNVIKKNHTIEDVKKMFGDPIVTTKSAFGGEAYSFSSYGDNTYYLYIETNADGVIKSYGALYGNFESKNRKYGDSWSDNGYGMGGDQITDNSDKVFGSLDYNTTRTEYNDYWKKLVENNRYLYDMQKHTIEAKRIYNLVQNYEFTQTYVSEDLFDIAWQLYTNNSSLYDYAKISNNQKKISLINSRSVNYNNFSLPNPLRLFSTAKNYFKGSGYKYLFYGVYPNDNGTWASETLFIDPTFLDKKVEVPLTNEEKIKFANVKNQYSIYKTHASKIENPIEEKWDYSTLPLKEGKYSEDYLQLVTEYLNIARIGIGLNQLKLNLDMSDAAQKKAALVMYNNINNLGSGHFPEKPSGVTDEYYKKAQSYMNENLYSGNPQTSIINALNDAYGDPVTCGHRYNLLNPYYLEWGVGSVGSGISMGWQGAHKFSGMGSSNVDLVAWPSNGIFPIDFAYNGIGNWTAYFFNGYRSTSDTYVVIKRLNDNSEYIINKDNLSSTKVLSLNGSLVTFRDDAITYTDGDVFEINIYNLNDGSGNLVNYAYRSVFYNFPNVDNIVEATDISLSQDNVTIKKGELVRVIAKVLPEDSNNKLMNFKIKNSSIATVRQDGTIVGVKPGKTSVTVESGNVSRVINVNVSDENGNVPDYLMGDMNQNGKIDLKDIIILIKIYIGSKQQSDLDLTIGDMNQNGKIDLSDIILTLKLYVNQK